MATRGTRHWPSQTHGQSSLRSACYPADVSAPTDELALSIEYPYALRVYPGETSDVMAYRTSNLFVSPAVWSVVTCLAVPASAHGPVDPNQPKANSPAPVDTATPAADPSVVQEPVVPSGTQGGKPPCRSESPTDPDRCCRCENDCERSCCEECRSRRRWSIADWKTLRRLDEEHGHGSDAMMTRAVGLSGSYYDVDGSDADARTLGLLLSFGGARESKDGVQVARTQGRLALGYGGGGVEGEFLLEGSSGFILPIGPGAGPFVRLGLGLEFLGNPKFYRSRFELPFLELGVQTLSDDVLFEVAGRGGVVLAGRFNTGDEASRKLGADGELGGLATLQVEHFRLSATGMRIFSHHAPGSPVDALRGQLCVEPLEGLLLCGDAAHHRGEVRIPGGTVSDSTVRYLGLSLGYGGIVVF